MVDNIPQITKENQVIDHDSLHRYRTEIPNILLDMELDPYELTLYLHLKRIAGDKGKCFASNKHLEEKTKISHWKLIHSKRILVQKGLIKITTRKKTNKSADTSLIEIIDLWPYNFEHFKKKKEAKRVGSEATEGRYSGYRGVGSEATGKEEHNFKKNHLKNPPNPPKGNGVLERKKKNKAYLKEFVESITQGIIDDTVLEGFRFLGGVLYNEAHESSIKYSLSLEEIKTRLRQDYGLKYGSRVGFIKILGSGPSKA